MRETMDNAMQAIYDLKDQLQAEKAKVEELESKYKISFESSVSNLENYSEEYLKNKKLEAKVEMLKGFLEIYQLENGAGAWNSILYNNVKNYLAELEKK